jgi:DNA-binding transcriptional regulator YhcF (GntR family)
MILNPSPSCSTARSTDATPAIFIEQVAVEIRRAIADREAKPGERLPPATDLVDVLGVNTNTVPRSLRVLREEGLLEFPAAVASPSQARPNAAPSSSERRSSSTLPAATVAASTNWSKSSRTGG